MVLTGERDERKMAGMKARELSARLAALQSVRNLLDWELQTGSVLGLSCDRTGVGRQIGRIRRELLLKSIRGTKKDPILNRTLDQMREKERRYTEEQAEEQDRLTREAGRVWKELRASAGGAGPDEQKEQQYRELLAGQIRLQREAVGQEGYERCLKDYEECCRIQEVEAFFAHCKKELKLLILDRKKQQGREGAVWMPMEHYEPERQRRLAYFLSEYLGFDHRRGKLGESEHPFTTAVNRDCVCWTDRYLLEDPFAGIFTALHEAGHGIYEQNVAPELAGTVLAGGCSDAMHEAVARFYENCIGRSDGFWRPIYGKVAEILGGEFEKLPFREFMRRVQWIEPGCIRTEADELTYPFHIILRYELERDLFEGKLSVEELSGEWKRKMKEYLGVEPETDREGYLQDIHWSAGQFGYFPAYQVGNAMAAQIYLHVERVLPLEDILKEGRMEQLKEYLSRHIFRYGRTRDSREILEAMTGQPLQYRMYMEYLQKRYGE